MDAELARLIGACRNHTSMVRVTADNYRLSLQLGFIPLLDRCVKCIHVDVDYFTDLMIHSLSRLSLI